MKTQPIDDKRKSAKVIGIRCACGSTEGFDVRQGMTHLYFECQDLQCRCVIELKYHGRYRLPEAPPADAPALRIA